MEEKSLKKMEIDDNQKIINISFYVFLVIIIQVILSDILIFFTGLKYSIAQIIILVINILLNFLLIKRKVITIKSNFEKWDLIFITLFVIILGLTIIFPDNSYDSYSYHIYLQKNVFKDKVTQDFFPGRTLTSYNYAIGDRIFTLFSNKLGYRLGTIPSYLILIVIYYEIKKIIDLLNKDGKRYINCILSILPLCTFIVLEQVGTYYIDNFSIALLLNFTYITLFENKNIFNNKKHLYYLAFLVGILISMKLTNAFYLVIPLIYLLIINIKDIKNIKVYDYLFLLVLFLLPSIVYITDAVIDTGSPVFPYYNSIFKSKYFEEINWFDDRFGANNWKEILTWPLVINKYCERGYEVNKIDYSFFAGYIVSIVYLIYLVIYKIIYKKYIRKEKITINKLYLCFSLLILYFNFVLAKFCIGYVRYGGIIPIVSSIFIIKMLLDFFENKKLFLTIIMSYFICAAAILGISNYLSTGKMRHYAGFFVNTNTQTILNNAMQNAICLFRDQDHLKYDIDGVWGVIADDSGIPSMLNVDDDIVQLSKGIKTGNTDSANKIYWDKVLNNDIFIPIYDDKRDAKLLELDHNNFEIVEIVNYFPNVLYTYSAKDMYIVKVKYNEKFEKNNKEIYNKLIEDYKK